MPKTGAPPLQQWRLSMTPHLWPPDQDARRMAVERGETVVAKWRTDAALKDWAEPRGLLVYIGRPMPKLSLKGSIWATTTCKIVRTASEEKCAACIAAHVRNLDANLDLLTCLPKLCGKVLLCFCHMRACHGHVLARRANALAGYDWGNRKLWRCATWV